MMMNKSSFSNKDIRKIVFQLVSILFMLSTSALQAYTSPIKSDEVVVFLPTIGYPIDSGKTWRLHIHGWIYEPQWGGSIRQKMRRLFNLTAEQANEDNAFLKQRLSSFFVDNERGKRIGIHLGEKRLILNNKSAKNGHFSDWLDLPAADIKALRHSAGDLITFKAITRRNDPRHFEGKIQLIDKTGISVISDIDDTIKISEVHDKRALLANTFLRAFQPVPNMADFYNRLAQQGKITFHYVSASPWQLYQPLAQFITEKGFPEGSFHLRLFRWKDKTFFKFFKSSREHKMKTIHSLIECCQQRRFILIGDSGENDPEIYASIAHQYPKQIKHIFIRDVTGEKTTRYEKTFKKWPKSQWTVFQDASKLGNGQ